MDDDLLEDDEIYLLTLTSDEPGLTLDPPVATVTIIDDDRECLLLWCLFTKYNLKDILIFCSHRYWFD